jgi:hypothetical protein
MFGPLIVLDVMDAFVVSGDNDKLKLLIDVTGRIQHCISFVRRHLSLVGPAGWRLCTISWRGGDTEERLGSNALNSEQQAN